MSVETGDLISRIYSNFRGVDFRGDEINIVRSPDCLNVWKDYKETDSIRTRPEMELNTAFDAPVYGVFFYDNEMLVHSGTKLYKVVDGKKTELYSGLREAVSDGFIYESIWYFKDGKHYLQYDGNTIGEVVGYVPTTSIGRKPSGGGTVHEDVNMLTGRRKNTFCANGEATDAEYYTTDLGHRVYQGEYNYWNGKYVKISLTDLTGDPKESGYKYNLTGDKVYYLDAQNIDTDFAPIVKVNDVLLDSTDYSVDYTKGRISFVAPPIAPLTDGQDNVSIEFRKTNKAHKDGILKCTLLQVFDNRVFVSGNDEYPNTIWHCSLNDPTYFSDLDYYNEGVDTVKVKGLVAGNNALWVFREPSQANTTVFYHTPTIDSDYGKIYPSQHSSITTGCVGRAINFNDDIVFFSERGMEGMSGDVTTEQAVAHRSTLVDRKMIAESDYKGMVLEEWEGYLLVFIGDKVYLADSRAMFTNENHYEYEWFYWSLGKRVTCAKVNKGVLYLGTEDGVYTMTDTQSAVESYWVTPKDKFTAPYKLKTSNKRGCVVEAKGDISVYAKVEDTDFELIGTYEGITDYFVSRIKRKKWKDIQLKFHSNTRFSLESATLEAFIGGYIKR